MGLGDHIIVNDFMFCRDHGYELCHYCFCDHRMCNNIRIESELDGVFEKTGYDVEERNPFSVYGLGAVQGPKKDTYQCRQHKKIDCEKCFDWVKIIKMDAGYPIGDDSSYLDTLD